MTQDSLVRLHLMLEMLRNLQGEAERLGLEELDHLLGMASLSAEEKLGNLPFATSRQEYVQ